MRRPRVLCTVDVDIPSDALRALQAVADVERIPVDRAALLERIGDCDAYLGGLRLQIDAAVIERAKHLRVVAIPATGSDHIDKKTLAEHGIAFLSLAKETELLSQFTATAELTWGLLIACVRRIPAAFDAVRNGDWAREKFTGRQLSGKTLGVLGMGRLGKIVAEYGKAFRMKVLGCGHKPFTIPGIEQVELNELLAHSDIITIHIHLTDENRGLISREAFAKMKPGVVLINTSRGAIIDEAAFLEALESGKVAAAGIDVIEGEWMEDITQHPLVRYAQTHDNLVITPHIGGHAVEPGAIARAFMANKLTEFLIQPQNPKI